MNRIDKKFKELHKKERKAFIAFIMAGDPNLTITYKLVLELGRVGVDIIELGVPFSDPTADGPVIQEASIRALKNNTSAQDVLMLVKKLREKTEIPIALLSYYNPIFHFGQRRFLNSAKSSGVDGIIIVDAIPEEMREFIKTARSRKIDTIFFASPTTDSRRIKLVNKLSRGFVYSVSLTGVTGARKKLPENIIKYLRSIKQKIKKPICVGFGISKPQQVKTLSRCCDGVIVGSAIVKKIKENIGHRDLVEKVGRFVERLIEYV